LADRYNRALEQGLLKLDPRGKTGPNGPGAYQRARAQVLREMDRGAVRITVSRSAAQAPLRIGMHESMLGADSAATGVNTDLWMNAEDQMQAGHLADAARFAAEEGCAAEGAYPHAGYPQGIYGGEEPLGPLPAALASHDPIGIRTLRQNILPPH